MSILIDACLQHVICLISFRFHAFLCTVICYKESFTLFPLPTQTLRHTTRSLQSADTYFPVIRHNLSREETAAELRRKLPLRLTYSLLPNMKWVDAIGPLYLLTVGKYIHYCYNSNTNLFLFLQSYLGTWIVARRRCLAFTTPDRLSCLRIPSLLWNQVHYFCNKAHHFILSPSLLISLMSILLLSHFLIVLPRCLFSSELRKKL